MELSVADLVEEKKAKDGSQVRPYLNEFIH